MASKYPSSPTEPRKFTVRAQHSGTIHAIVCYFDLFVDKGRKHVVSTHPGVASRNRDMAWGQQVQSVRNPNANPYGSEDLRNVQKLRLDENGFAQHEKTGSILNLNVNCRWRTGGR